MAHVHSALARRLGKLRSGDVFSILALDHGLTSGMVEGLEDVNRWSQFADSSGIAALVTNVGTARRLPTDRRHALILQTMGSPNILGQRGSRRVLNSSVEEAVRLDADCISVQIDFNGANVEASVSEISSVRMSAHQLNIPVLVMITTPKAGFKDGKEILDAISVAHELGADLIKVTTETNNAKPEPQLSQLANIAPVVMAGGAAAKGFFENLQNAKRLGFSGYCVGRNVFQSDTPLEVLRRIRKAFEH